MPLLHLTAVRYEVPLREGGSLPAVIDTDDGSQFVVKFRGAGQGPKALVAELLAARLAEALALPVPRPAVVQLDGGFGLAEPDPEIQDLLRWSAGLNFGLEYLPGAIGFESAADAKHVDPQLAAAIVWFDALISNVDRTPRNPNLLLWAGELWLIDHGAAFYFHHAGGEWLSRAHSPFPQIKDHILLSRAGDLREADERLSRRLTPGVLTELTSELPDAWLEPEPQRLREAYNQYLSARLEEPRVWMQEAENVRSG